MSVSATKSSGSGSLENGLYPKPGALKGSRSEQQQIADVMTAFRKGPG
jgi:hypothetical protein